MTETKQNKVSMADVEVDLQTSSPLVLETTLYGAWAREY